MKLKGKKVGFVLTGSFCTFKNTILQIENIVKEEAEVIPIMSYNAYNLDTKFGKASDFIDQIEKISTIFYQDLEEYTVNVDIDYITDKIIKIMNSKNHTKDQILNESTEFISIIGKIDKRLYKKIMLELLKRDILVSNYVQIYENNGLSENLRGILAKLQLYENSNITKYVDEIKFQHLKSLLYSSIFYEENKEEIDETFILKENTKILEKIKGELKDK